MTDNTWIDARERKPAIGETVIVHRKDGVATVVTLGADAGQWMREFATHWMPLPPLPERDDKAAMLEDVFGGEWRKADNGEYECGHFTATVADALVAIGRETARGTLRITVHVDADQEVRRALEILRDELREMHESVGGLLGDEKSPRERLRDHLDQLCKAYQEKRWQQCIDGRYHQAVEKAITGGHVNLLDARDLERLTGISADKWMMMA